MLCLEEHRKNKYTLACPGTGDKYLTIAGSYVSSRAKGKDEAADGAAPVEPEQDTIVSHAGRVFDDIKTVQEAGGHAKSRTLYAVSYTHLTLPTKA